MFSINKHFTLGPSLHKYIMETTNKSIENKLKKEREAMIDKLFEINTEPKIKSNFETNPNPTSLLLFVSFISFLAGYHVKRITSQ